MRLKLATAATGDPLTLQEAKDHLVINTTVWDGEVARKLSVATDYCQRRIGGHRQFMPASYDGILKEFPLDDGPIVLPLPPLQSITKISYINSTGGTVSSTGGTTSWSSTSWITVAPTDSPGYIEPAYGKSWPSTRLRPDAVTIRFLAGYADSDSVPDSVKAAVCLALGHFWENREAVITGISSKPVEMGVDALLSGLDYGHYA